MRILITGANGFVGHHLLPKLLNSNHVIHKPSRSELNLLNINSLKEYCSVHNINSIIHLASLCGGIGINKDNPGRFIYENLQMGINVLETARTLDMLKVINLSTVCSYPKFSPIPFNENNIWDGYPEETNAPYGIAKKTIMLMGQSYNIQYGLNVVNLVPVNMMGEYDHFDLYSSHVIPALIKKFEEAKDSVTLWGTGEVSREFLYAGDCVEAILIALNKEGLSPEPINLGTGKEIKIKDLANLVKEVGGYNNVDIIWDTSKPDGQPRRCLDISRAKERLNWKPVVPIREALMRTINWYRENVK